MALFLKTAAGVLLTLVLLAELRRQEKDLALLLSMAVCAMVCLGAVSLMEPVVELLGELEALGELDGKFLELLLKSAGIGLTAEVSAAICADGGNAALGKVLRLLGSAAILCLSVPMFRTLMEVIQEMVGAA